jgi:penicillin-binding protein 1C
MALLLLVLSLLALRLWPGQSLQQAFPASRSVLAANGELLRLTLAADQQYRLWTPLAAMAPRLPEAVLLYEDRWFYWHPGVNPWALLRASVATASGSRRIGGSTISMQLARRLYQIDSRTVGGKLHQAGAAIWLEARYGKRAILEAYLNSAPYGGNVEGVGAASLLFWRKPVAQLNLAEAINLAVIPQNPKKRLADSAKKADPQGLQAARLRLAASWAKRHPLDRAALSTALLALPFKNRASLPFLAPHWVDYVLQTRPGAELHTTLDMKAQSLLERLLRDYVKTQAAQGIDNASALLVDSQTMQVKAMVGSSDYHNAAIAGQVNGVFAKRSPGSTLKPFIYAQALDQGLIHSASILRDAPSNFGAFAPENFDGRFNGPIPAWQALIKSRNIPAVALASKLSKPGLYEFLKLGGVQKLAAEAHYGLALALGGAEVSMEELARLYAILPNGGQWRSLAYVMGEGGTGEGVRAGAGAGASVDTGERTHGATRAQPDARWALTATAPGSGQSGVAPLTLISPEAAFITLDMLRQTPRPDTFTPARPAVAWKTGTSWGFRDAWTAGVFGRYVLVVWVGNFNGASNPALIGIEAAAPLFMRMVDGLRAEKLDMGGNPVGQPANVQRFEVCAASGDLPNQACPVTAPAWFIAGKSPIRYSTLHRTVLIDQKTGRRACVAGPHTRAEVVEYWSSDMLALSRQAGLPLRLPPQGECADGDGLAGVVPQAGAALSATAASAAESAGAPRIISPLRGVTHLQRLNQAQALLLRADAGPGAGKLRWFADDSLLGQVAGGATLAWQPPHAGRYVLRVVDQNGLADSREVTVQTVE